MRFSTIFTSTGPKRLTEIQTTQLAQLYFHLLQLQNMFPKKNYLEFVIQVSEKRPEKILFFEVDVRVERKAGTPLSFTLYPEGSTKMSGEKVDRNHLTDLAHRIEP